MVVWFRVHMNKSTNLPEFHSLVHRLEPWEFIPVCEMITASMDARNQLLHTTAAEHSNELESIHTTPSRLQQESQD